MSTFAPTLHDQHLLFSPALRARIEAFKRGEGELTVLWDQDSVQADWELGFVNAFRRDFPHLTTLGVGERYTFNLYEGLTQEEIDATNTVMDTMSYAALQPIQGSIDAMLEMKEAGINVGTLSSPWLTNPSCASDKYAWSDRYPGPGWATRTILAKDKTTVLADILIDDKPNITGAFTPAWEHVVFDQSYNRDVVDRPRMVSGSQWRAIILGE